MVKNEDSIEVIVVFCVFSLVSWCTHSVSKNEKLLGKMVMAVLFSGTCVGKNK